MVAEIFPSLFGVPYQGGIYNRRASKFEEFVIVFGIDAIGISGEMLWCREFGKP